MRRAVWFCLPFAAAVALCRMLLPESALPLTAAALAVASLAGTLLRGGRRTRALLLSLGALLGTLCCIVQLKTVIRPAEERVGEKLTVSARVVEYPDVYDTGAYVTVRLTQQGLPRVRCRLSSNTEGTLDGLEPGDLIECPVRLLSAAVRNGEETDAYAARGIFLRASCTDEPVRTGRWRLSFLYFPQTLARAVQTQCARLFPPDASPFMTALLTGEKDPLYADGARYYQLSEAGLSHVVAVSGMHMAFLAGFFFLLMGRSRPAVLACIPVLLLFAAMTGFTPSVTRAVFMQSFLLLAPVFGREEDAPTSLSVALAVLLLVNPAAVAGVSLQLSFASLAGIWLFSERIYRAAMGWLASRFHVRRGLGQKILSFLAGSLSASLGAQVFTAPLAAAHFGYVSTVAPLSGLACLWVVSVLYAGGFLTVALGALLPGAGAFCGGVLAWGVRYIYAASRMLGELPCAAVYTSNPVFIVWLVGVYALFFIAWLRSRRGGALRPLTPLFLALITLYGSVLAVQLTRSEALRVTALDVGQGQSVVLTCGPRAVVVDCGGWSYPRDPGDTAVRFLRGGQRRHLDALILTHLHADHVSGVPRLLAQTQVDALYLPAQPDEDGYLPEILAAAAAGGTRVEYVTENLRLAVGDMELTVWAPLLSGEQNENCLTVMAAQEDFEVLITGDNPGRSEQILTGLFALPDAEVLVVGHHGSRTSTTTELLEELRPDVALISAGKNNTYGHPSPEVLERLEGYGITILRTDLEGNITVEAERKR